MIGATLKWLVLLIIGAALAVPVVAAMKLGNSDITGIVVCIVIAVLFFLAKR